MKKFKRILLKLSGEGLFNTNGNFLNTIKTKALAEEIKLILKKNIELCLVVGGGNICRGCNSDNTNLKRVTTDNIGMMGTIINGLVLQDIFLQHNLPSILVSALEVNKIASLYNIDKVTRYLTQKKVVILTGGIANPYFSTDTTAVIRASELECDAILKATQVSGVFTKDPKHYKDAIKIDKISYNEVIEKKLSVMDIHSIILAQKNKIPIYIFNMHEPSSIINLISGRTEYSVIS